MEKVEVQLYVSAHFNAEGQFTGYNVNQFQPDERVREYGFFVNLFSTKVHIEVPVSEAEMRGKAAAAVDETLKKAQAAHAARVTALFRLKNQLLLLEAPSVLDPIAGSTDPALKDPDDDIPF